MVTSAVSDIPSAVYLYCPRWFHTKMVTYIMASKQFKIIRRVDNCDELQETAEATKHDRLVVGCMYMQYWVSIRNGTSSVHCIGKLKVKG